MLNACFMEKVDISSAPEPDPWNSLFIKAPIEKYIPTFPILLSRSMSLLCLMLSFPLWPANTIQPSFTQELRPTLILCQIPALVFLNINRPAGAGSLIAPVVDC